MEGGSLLEKKLICYFDTCFLWGVLTDQSCRTENHEDKTKLYPTVLLHKEKESSIFSQCSSGRIDGCREIQTKMS